jgi:hypothetical protein
MRSTKPVLEVAAADAMCRTNLDAAVGFRFRPKAFFAPATSRIFPRKPYSVIIAPHPKDFNAFGPRRGRQIRAGILQPIARLILSAGRVALCRQQGIVSGV